ncbi:unnamed protein product, partial [marine sediment metagenome]
GTNMMTNDYDSEDSSVKLILDTDTSTGVLGAEIDDGFAILLCLALEKLGKVRLLGITEVAGNTNVDQGVMCALKMLELTGRGDIPVYKGVGRPLVLEKRKPPFNPDTVTEPLGSAPKNCQQQEHAVDFIIQKAREFPGQITLVPIGPLMNIAMAILKDPDIIPLIKEIVAMGGEFNGVFFPGGFNWWFCPHSAQIVLRAGIPITIVPTDVTVKTALTLKQLNSLGEGELVNWLKGASEPFMTHKAGEEKAAYLHDPLAVAIAVDKTIAKQSRELYVDTIIDGPWAGMTIGQETT